MKPNEIIDNMAEIIAKCQEFRKKALKDYQEESAVLRRGKEKMDPREYRTLRLDNMRQYSEQSKAFCLMTIAACEAVMKQLEGENPYKAVYTKKGDMAIWDIEQRKKGGKVSAKKQSRKTDEGYGGRDPVRERRGQEPV